MSAEDRELVVAAAEALVDAAIQNHHDSRSEETFQECHACGEWEGHREGCPIPVVIAWLEKPP